MIQTSDRNECQANERSKNQGKEEEAAPPTTAYIMLKGTNKQKRTSSNAMNGTQGNTLPRFGKSSKSDGMQLYVRFNNVPHFFLSPSIGLCACECVSCRGCA